MRVNKVITMTPAYHKWASSQPNFSEWVQRRIDEYVNRDMAPTTIQDAPTVQLAAALYNRVQTEGWPECKPEFTQWFKQLMIEAWGEEE